MAAHLSHKIRWNLLVDYLSPLLDNGIALPIGECGQIHLLKKKHKIQVEMRKYITAGMICTAEDCKTVGDKIFYKNSTKRKPFGMGRRNEEKLSEFLKNICDVIEEFASTELESPVKSIKYNVEKASCYGDVPSCDHCNEFVTYLEFGDKQKLFEYTESDLNRVFCCLHGGQAVGNNIHFLLHHVLNFYIYSNVVVYLGLTTKDQWPKCMRPDSYFRRTLLYACDGQTFLPHSRKYLDSAMIDLDQTRELSKNLFRFIYFYVIMRKRWNSSYNVRDDIGDLIMIYRRYL